jgi:hypothetical protein
VNLCIDDEHVVRPSLSNMVMMPPERSGRRPARAPVPPASSDPFQYRLNLILSHRSDPIPAGGIGRDDAFVDADDGTFEGVGDVRLHLLDPSSRHVDALPLKSN